MTGLIRLAINLIFTISLLGCDSHQPVEEHRGFEKIAVETRFVTSKKLPILPSLASDNYVLVEDSLFVIRPYNSVVEVFDANSMELLMSLPIRKVEKRGNITRLVGGTMITLLPYQGSYYTIEKGPPKILQYDKQWVPMDTIPLGDKLLIGARKPGVFEIIDDQLVISADDLMARIAYFKEDIASKEPLLFQYSPETQKVKNLVLAEDFFQGANTDTLSFFRMTTTEDGFLLSEIFNPTLHKFDKQGNYSGRQTGFDKAISFAGYTKEDAYGEKGILEIYSDREQIGYFIKRKAEGGSPSSYQLINFDLATNTYWTYELSQDTNKYCVFLKYKDNHLHYLEFDNIKKEVWLRVVEFTY